MTEDEIFEGLDRGGVDLSVIGERFMGKREIYLKMLRVLKKDTSFRDLRDALLADDYKRAFESAHTLKGIAGNLGFERVLQNLVPLVELLRGYESGAPDRDEVDGYMREVEADYGKIEEVLGELDG